MRLFEDTYSEVNFPPPRDFQVTAHEKLREGIRDGHRRQLLVAPTGSGKTFLGLRIAHEALIKGRRALFVCDRTALIEQTSERASAYGLTAHGIVQANHWRRDNSMQFQIASIQTIQARGYWPPADVIVIDEAHTQYTAAKEKLLRNDAAIVGLTATPCSKGLGKYYQNMVNAATMHELTQAGVLVPMRILSCVTPDMNGAATNSGGEWTAKAASEREVQIIGDVVSEWIKHGDNRKTIAFGADIAYCTELASRFNEAGIVAEVFTCETKDAERATILEEFRKSDSRIRILVSVEALAKGFDVEDIECVIDARPLRKSLSTAIQMWGRGLRSCPAAGKTDCLLLDHSGNIQRFLKDFTDVFFEGFESLDMSEKLDQEARKTEENYTPSGCPKCSAKPFLRRCMKCGFEKQTLALVGESSGEMREIMIGKKVAAASKDDLWLQICTYAKHYVSSPKKAGWAFYKFKEITGQSPPKAMPFDFAPEVPISAATSGKLRSLRIAYNKARQHA